MNPMVFHNEASNTSQCLLYICWCLPLCLRYKRQISWCCCLRPWRQVRICHRPIVIFFLVHLTAVKLAIRKRLYIVLTLISRASTNLVLSCIVTSSGWRKYCSLFQEKLSWLLNSRMRGDSSRLRASVDFMTELFRLLHHKLLCWCLPTDVARDQGFNMSFTTKIRMLGSRNKTFMMH